MPKYFTPEGLEKLKKELEYLENVKRKEIAKALKEAASQGDLSENAGYQIAKEEQAFLEKRISELRKTIAQAQIIKKRGDGKVEIGSFVELESEEGKEKFQIVSPEEADISKGKISFKSPLGEKLLGKKEGEELKVGEIKYRILKVD